MRKKPQQERAKETVRIILEASVQVIAARGIEGLTTRRVAERAGVSVGSLYQYFPNKEAILEAILDQKVEEMESGARMMALMAENAPIDQVISVMARGLIHLQQQHQLTPELQSLARALPGAFQRRVNATERGRVYLRRILQRRAQDLRPMDPELVSYVVAYTLQGNVIGLDCGIEPWFSDREELLVELERLLRGYLLPTESNKT